MALVFLFVVASIGFMIKATVGNLSFVTGFALICFVALAVGVFIGAFVQARRWERDAH